MVWGAVITSALVFGAIAYFTLTSPSDESGTEERVTRATEAAAKQLRGVKDAVKAGAAELQERVKEAVETEKKKEEEEAEGEEGEDDEDGEGEEEEEEEPVVVHATAVPRKTRSRKE